MDFDLEKLAYIQDKLKTGVTEDEAREFLQWVDSRVFHNFVLENIEKLKWDGKPVDKETVQETVENGELFGGWCFEANHVSFRVLQNSGADVSTMDTMNFFRRTSFEDCGENEFYRHVATVPTMNICGKSQVHRVRYILDATFKQFCLKPSGASNIAKKLAQTQDGYQMGCELSNVGFSEFGDSRVKAYCDALRRRPINYGTSSPDEYTETFIDQSAETYHFCRKVVTPIYRTPKQLLAIR